MDEQIAKQLVDVMLNDVKDNPLISGVELCFRAFVVVILRQAGCPVPSDLLSETARFGANLLFTNAGEDGLEDLKALLVKIRGTR